MLLCHRSKMHIVQEAARDGGIFVGIRPCKKSIALSPLTGPFLHPGTAKHEKEVIHHEFQNRCFAQQAQQETAGI